MTSGNISVTTVVVAKSGTADYQTISEAVKNVKPKTRILIQPGLYQESIAIDKPLEIWGDGRVYIESIDASCIVMQTKHALVRGLILHNSNKNNYPAVNVTQGKLVLEDCNITSNLSSCVVISGSLANATVRRCCIHDAKGNGIYTRERATGSIEDCDIYGTTNPGIYVSEGSNLTVSRCRIYDCRSNGIYLTNNGLGKISDCDIYGNTSSGICIDKGSNPTVSQCRIYDGKKDGILIKDNGLGKISDCDIYGNTVSGICIDKGSNPTVSQCRIYDGKKGGILIKSNGLGTIFNCDIHGNTYCEVGIYQGGDPTISQCRIYDGKGGGVVIRENGLGRIFDCEIHSNVCPGIYISEGSNPTVSQCRIYDGKSYGIWITKNGLGKISDCSIYRHADVGVKISDKSNPTLRRCHIAKGKREAILIDRQGQGSFQYCKVDRHSSPGIKIEEKCQPTFRRCTLKTTQPAYWELTTVLALAVVSPLAVAAGSIALTGTIMLAAIASAYYQLYQRGFRHSFVQAVISLIVVFGFSAGNILISGFGFWSTSLLAYSGYFLIKNTLHPALEQSKLISKYDLEREVKPSKKIGSSRL